MIYTYAKIQNTDNLTTISNSNKAVINYLPKTVAKLDESAKEITDRKTINITNTDTINFKAYAEFNNTEDMLDYFLAEITKIYQEHGMSEVEDKIKKFVAYTKKVEFRASTRVFNDAKDLYNFLRKVTLFAAISFKTPYNKIANIISCFFFKCGFVSPVSKTIVNFLRSIEIQDIHEVATNKNLYLYISSKEYKYNLSLDEIQKFTDKRYKGNINGINTINQIVYSCNSTLKKQIISKYVTNILQVCTNKSLTINYTFIDLVKELVTSNTITATTIGIILKKIAIYLQAIDDKNAYGNISMLTNFFCSAKDGINKKNLFNLCRKTDKQLKYMALQQKLLSIKNNNISNEFSTSSPINKKEKHFNASEDKTKKNEATTSQKSVQESSAITQQARPSVIVLNKSIIKENTVFKVRKGESVVLYVDKEDCNIISKFCAAEKKLLASDEVHDTNATNNSEAKKRQADEQNYNQAKKVKFL